MMTMRFQNHVKKVSRLLGFRAECGFHKCVLRVNGDVAAVCREREGECHCELSAMECPKLAQMVVDIMAREFPVVAERDKVVLRVDRR